MKFNFICGLLLKYIVYVLNKIEEEEEFKRRLIVKYGGERNMVCGDGVLWKDILIWVEDVLWWGYMYLLKFWIVLENLFRVYKEYLVVWVMRLDI